MQLFFRSEPTGSIHTLDAEESRHCVKVLRMRAGQEVSLTDGKGNLWLAEIIEANPKSCVLQVSGHRESMQQQAPGLHMAVAPTKNMDRFEWFLEKATECGVNEVTPIICENSERTVVKRERLEKIMVTAMKQSLRTWLPKLHQPVAYHDFLGKVHSNAEGFIAWCGETDKHLLQNVCEPGQQALILIGPEGDFSEQEFQQALDAGFRAISLGPYRLRTETAALACCISFQALNKHL